MKFVVAPDSFKESLSALQVARAIAEAIRDVIPAAKIEIIPMADGGEGTVEALTAAAEGELLSAEVTGPLGTPVQAIYGIINNGNQGDKEQRTAVLEAASVFGLSFVPIDERNPYRTTTRGMGELMLQLLNQGIRRFIIGLGGSGTNDGGIGMLAALGAKFYNGQGQSLYGYGQDLLELKSVNVEALDARLSECDIVIASDVQNPLCGSDGASVIYGPQKGAQPDQVTALDLALNQYADILEEQTGRKAKTFPGAGAAGGTGFALLSVGAKIVQGAEVVANASRLRSKLTGADWVITGEGKSDNQTLNGKLPLYVARLAKEAGVRTILISGSLGENADELEMEFAASFSCVPRPMSLAVCLEQAEKNLSACARNVVRLIRSES
ncbi:glycerate kinase [Cohnella silvisoli]|uniref:Glycerate kinase n=1 Tax=Cohnella silvisoli TaxID=2873699 RepID=A0ABV1KU68_9BACL|nr:glycerate kinase [Cohnella silvisoli]MCD9023208.1 glycerate kinase [Cohnella silvisoli]